MSPRRRRHQRRRRRLRPHADVIETLKLFHRAIRNAGVVEELHRLVDRLEKPSKVAVAISEGERMFAKYLEKHKAEPSAQ